MNERTLELGEKFQRLGRVSGEPCGHAALRRSIADKRAQHRKMTNVSGSKQGVTRSFGRRALIARAAAVTVPFLTNGHLRIMSGRPRSSRGSNAALDLTSAPAPSSGRCRRRPPTAHGVGRLRPSAARARLSRDRDGLCGASSTSSSWTCRTSLAPTASRSSHACTSIIAELDQVGGRSLHRRVDRRALGRLAARTAAGVDVRQPEPAPEHRLDVALRACELTRASHVLGHARDSG